MALYHLDFGNNGKSACGRTISKMMMEEPRKFNGKYQWNKSYCCTKCAKIADSFGYLKTNAQKIGDAIRQNTMTDEQRKALAQIVEHFYAGIIEDTYGYDMRTPEVAKHLRDQTTIATHKKLGNAFEQIFD